jgi:hypothetical protein
MNAQRLRFLAAAALFLAWVAALATMALTTARRPESKVGARPAPSGDAAR